MSGLSTRRGLVLILGAGLALRLVLAFVIYPGQGLAGDIGSFNSWASQLAQSGPATFYANAARADYPVGYLYVLWLLGSLASSVGPMLGIPADRAILLALKLPAICADLGIGLLLFYAARRWMGPRAGLAAAALYLFLPVTWYDSALWGQVDAVSAFLMLASLVLLIDGWSEAALTVATLGVLVKPQAFVALVVIVPVLIHRHVLRVGSGPAPRLGSRLVRFNARLGGFLTAQGPARIASSALIAGTTAIVALLPFDIEHFAPASLASLPLLGKVAGLIGLFQSASGEFSVLTANAYNAWALIGATPLSTNIGSDSGQWTADSMTVLGGIPAVLLGGLLLGGVCLLVAAGLLVRDGRLAIVLGFTLVAFAFYTLPTRVHERYLFPAFVTGALLAVRGASWTGAYLGVGGLNVLNLHAVLAAGLRIGFGTFTGAGGGSLPGVGSSGGPPDPVGAAGPGGAGVGGGAGIASRASDAIRLPFAQLARSEPVVIAAAVGQTLAFVLLLGLWLVLVLRPEALADPAMRPPRVDGSPLPSAAT